LPSCAPNTSLTTNGDRAGLEFGAKEFIELGNDTLDNAEAEDLVSRSSAEVDVRPSLE
jgi:hypothetical protein